MSTEVRFADLILTGGRIYTSEQTAPRAGAIAVAGERIVAIGTEADVGSLAGPGTRTVPLDGRCVVPGLIDSHVHLLGFGLSLGRPDLRNDEDIAESLSRIREAATHAQPDEWIVASGWDRNRWRHLPTHNDLDGAVAGQPVLVWSRDGHAAWLNSEALRLSGVSATTVSPPGGEVVRDSESGEPTGLLLENAMELVSAAMPALSETRCERAISQAVRVAVSKGLTGVQVFDGQETMVALQRLRSRGELPLRVCCHLPKEGLDAALQLGIQTGFGDEWIRLGHLKLFLDGALGSQTAHMLDRYEGSESRGIATMHQEELTGLVSRAVAGGIAPAIHAIGDAANRVALDVLEETRPAWKLRGLRPRLEHAQLLHPADLVRLGELGVIASMQPVHAVSDWPAAERLWGNRNVTAYAWRSLLDAGAKLAFGSDSPVEPIDPLLGMHAAVTRQRSDGRPPGGWHPEQRLRPLEALVAYTLGSAYSSGEEALKGTLAPGKLADFVVLSVDPMGEDPAGAGDREWVRKRAFLSTSVEATVVGGMLVFGEL